MFFVCFEPSQEGIKPKIHTLEGMLVNQITKRVMWKCRLRISPKSWPSGRTTTLWLSSALTFSAFSNSDKIFVELFPSSLEDEKAELKKFEMFPSNFDLVRTGVDVFDVEHFLSNNFLSTCPFDMLTTSSMSADEESVVGKNPLSQLEPVSEPPQLFSHEKQTWFFSKMN